MSTFILKTFTPLAGTRSVDNLFHVFIVLCENEYFLISNIHWSFTNVTSCPLVVLSFLSEKKIFLSIFSYPLNILKTSIWSPLNQVCRVVKPQTIKEEDELGTRAYLSLFDVVQRLHIEGKVIVRECHFRIRVTAVIACSGGGDN